jgi:hypothetical protein
MKKNKYYLLFFTLLIVAHYSNYAQLFNPSNKFRQLGVNTEVGVGLDFKSGTTNNIFANAGGSIRLWNYLVYRPNVYLVAKVNNKNYKTDRATKWLHEVCIHPFKFGKDAEVGLGYLGFYAALDQNIRNYSFDDVTIYDNETGAAVREEFGENYTKGQVAFQYALPCYRVGLSYYSYHKSKIKDKKTVFDETGGFAANIYLFYNIVAQQANDAIIASRSYFNINVPTSYAINNVSVFNRGIGFGIHGITSQLVTMRVEFGTRPSLYLKQNKSLSVFAKGGYIAMNICIRLI